MLPLGSVTKRFTGEWTVKTIPAKFATMLEGPVTTIVIDWEVVATGLPPRPVIPADGDQLENGIPGLGVATRERSSAKSNCSVTDVRAATVPEPTLAKYETEPPNPAEIVSASQLERIPLPTVTD